MRVKVSEEKVQSAQPGLMSELIELKAIIERAYQEQVLLNEAEKYAARFLHAQMLIAEELANTELDSRMRKNGLKAVKAAIWHKAATDGDKKPSDKMLDSVVDMNDIVQKEQDEFDKIDSHKESLKTYLSIFKDAHIYFRNISKGSYE